jgi:hypothetical protein
MKINRNLWPLGVIGAFALFFVGMATVVVIASTHRDHLVADNYYEQELSFQGQIDSADRAKKSGATVTFDSATGQVVIALAVGQLQEKLPGTVVLYRPSEPKLDREFLLEPKADGTQILNVSQLKPGPWLVRVAWKSGVESFYLEQKFTIAAK